MKYVLVSGGVISGIGKGIIASSTGLLLKTLGLKVTAIKIDPYMNVDAGTMAPTEHGEVFVLNDGGEVDLDLGNYERYLNVTLTRENNITTGKIYQHVIERERRGDYLGRTVQVVPHLTDATQDWIERVARIPVDDTNEEPDACIIELGGTVGDIESGPFIEAMRQLRRRAGKDNFLHIHVSLVPVINDEQKTKPTQAAIKDVRSVGLSPDLIACRCSTPLEKSTTDKIAMFCQVEPEQVVAVHDVSSTYHVPLLLETQGLIELLTKILRLDTLDISPSLAKKGEAIWKAWKTLTKSQDHSFQDVPIVLVGKYTNLHDSYLSVIKSLEHAAMACSRRLKLIWVDASHLEEECSRSSPAEFHKAWHEVCTAQGILVPGGFGQRGTEGMIAAAKWARTNKTPYLGICLGMQIAVIEFARHVCGIKNATSEELQASAEDKVIVYMPEIDRKTMGGNMRLGIRPTHFQPGGDWSRLRGLYLPNETIDTPKSDRKAPLRGLSSYMFFANEHRGQIRKEHPDVHFAQVGKLLAERWRALSPAQREPYEAMARADKERYETEKASYSVDGLQTNGAHEGQTTHQNSAASTTEPADAAHTSPVPAEPIILERHRHRYEVNPEYIERLEAAGLTFVGKDDRGERMEVLELGDHPWFVGVQFHPEYLSRVLEPSRPYLGFVAASAGCLGEVMTKVEDRARRRATSALMSVGAGTEGLVNGLKGVVI